MGGKHMKKLRAEKSKVKLKKKTLPKGQNITDTTFKVKKILTIEQLKKVDKEEPVSSWNVPLKDLLIRLNHYNYTSRLNALNGIKELITNYSDILKGPSLKLIVTRVLELLSDDEHKIRVTAIELLDCILSSLSSGSVNPFYDILNVHLSCAMTHRNVSVQQDSLKFIDVMINHAPDAVKRNFQSLVQNFTRIIKSNLYGSNLDSSLKGPKQELEKSRTEMFFRFYQFLSIAYAKSESGKQSDCRIVVVNNNSRRIPLGGYNNQYKKIPNLSSLFKKSDNEKKITGEFDPAEFKVHCSLIMPLLFDTWIEFSPSQTQSEPGSECALPESVGALLHIIMRILLLIHERVLASGDSDLEGWYVSTYGPTFKKSFMPIFPYVSLSSGKKPQLNVSSEFVNSGSTGYIKQNLIICYLAYLFKVTQGNSEMEAKIQEYVSNVLMAKNPTGIDLLSKVVDIMNSKKGNKSDSLLATIIKAHNATHSPELRRKLSDILMKTIMENDKTVTKNPGLLKWMTSLPDQLHKSRISPQLVETISEMIKRPIGAQILNEVEEKAMEIVENLPNAQIDGVTQFEGQKMIINILYWCDGRVLEKVIKSGLLERSSYIEPLKSYIINVFSYKLTNSSS